MHMFEIKGFRNTFTISVKTLKSKEYPKFTAKTENSSGFRCNQVKHWNEILLYIYENKLIVDYLFS